MKGEKIPDEHHVARYCGFTTLDEDRMVSASAFMLKKGESELSVNWLENLAKPDRQGEIATLRRVYSSKPKPLKVGAQAKIAVLNVGKTCRWVFERSPDRRKLSILHDPEVGDESHSGIYNLRFEEDDVIAEIIAQAVSEDYPAPV